jgi:hypothetical protein
MSDQIPFGSMAPSLAGQQPPANFATSLNPLDEMAYRQWVADNNVPTDPTASGPQDYDMRGFYRALMQQNPRAQSAIDPNDNKMHYPDFWKTPSHETFSNESQWATPNTPAWTADDKLAAPSGRVIYDDKNRLPPFGLALRNMGIIK